MNEHWMTGFNLCSACAMNYTLITHLEKSKDEIDPLLEKIGLSGKISIGEKYFWKDGKKVDSPVEEKIVGPPDELHWKNVPRETAELIYKHYFLDFVVFGYSPDDVLKYINASDPSKSRPPKNLINKSRLAVSSLQKSYFKRYTDTVCTI